MTNPGEHAQQMAPEGASAPEPALPLVITHSEMDSAFERGEATPVGQSIGWLMRHRKAWWVIYEDGWLRLIESTVTEQIDQLYPRLAKAEAQAAAEAARDRNRSRAGGEPS